jgi:hypothetical protein
MPKSLPAALHTVLVAYSTLYTDRNYRYCSVPWAATGILEYVPRAQYIVSLSRRNCTQNMEIIFFGGEHVQHQTIQRHSDILRRICKIQMILNCKQVSLFLTSMKSLFAFPVCITP